MKVLGEQDDDNKPEGVTRRHALECMIWAGTGVLWTVSGGVPKSLGLLGSGRGGRGCRAASPSCRSRDSHVGFDKAANPHALDTLEGGDRQGQGAAGEARRS